MNRDERPASEDLGRLEDDADDASLDDDFVDFETFEIQCRLWIRAITPILQLKSPDSRGNVRVQFAFDRLQTAACERLIRLLDSDLPNLEA